MSPVHSGRRVRGPLFGLETEYGAAPAGGVGSRTSGLEAAGRLWSTAAADLRCLPDESDRGIFLTSGSRLYVDGQHLEYSAVETSHPDDAVRYSLAGDRLIERLLAGVSLDERPVVFKSNVDYLSGTTWGAHESYLSIRSPHCVNPGLVSHLVSRVVFAGSGGFASTPRGLRFALSPRAFFCTDVVSSAATTGRGIVHIKNEPLSVGEYHRIHVTCGENLLSERALWLKVATTALVVAMLDAELDPGKWVVLRNPVRAFHRIAADPACRARVGLESGQTVTAIDIQREYLHCAEHYLGAEFMPPWAADACAKWRAVLDELESGAPTLATSLDWAVRHSLFSRALASRGSSWTDLEYRNAPLRAAGGRGSSPVGIADFEKASALRCDLCALDLRFGQLGGSGVFSELERAGVLSHRQPGVGDIAPAIDSPPAYGRGRVRGLAVQRLAGTEPRYRCDWHRVTSRDHPRWLDLNDPFMETECWRDARTTRGYSTYETLPVGPPLDWGAFSGAAMALNAYQGRRFEEAYNVLQRLIAEGHDLPSTHCHMARVLLILGDLPGAAANAERAMTAPGLVPDHIVARVAWLRLLIAMLSGASHHSTLIALKAHFCRPRPLNSWAMGPVIELIDCRLAPEQASIILALLRAGTGAETLESLDRFEWWTSLPSASGGEGDAQ